MMGLGPNDTFQPQGLPLQKGIFVAVAGPSGSGKDSVMQYAQERLGSDRDGIVFVRRIITRPQQAGSEAHDSLDEQSFAEALAAGKFALSWRANGLSYAVPLTIEENMRCGQIVVANVSRGVLAEIYQRYSHVITVIITAPHAILAQRLAARGRENPEEVKARLHRGTASNNFIPADATIIENSGTLEKAGEQFLALLRNAVASNKISDADDLKNLKII